MIRSSCLDPIDAKAIAHRNLINLRRNGAQASIVRQCEAWLDEHDPGWRHRPQAVG